MTIKERALAAVKTAYAKYGLKAEELDKIANNIAGGLTEETTDDDLNKAVKAAEFYAEMMQSVGNRKQGEIEKKYEGWVDPKKTPKPDPKPTDPPTDPKPDPKPTDSQYLTLEQAKELFKEGIKEAIAPLTQQRETERLAKLLADNEELKDIPASFRAKYTLDKEENLATVVQNIKTDFTALKQEMFASGTIVEAPKPGTPQSENQSMIDMFKEVNKVEVEPKK